jgi:hypothetical protein
MSRPRVTMVTGKFTAGFMLLSGFRPYDRNRHGNDRTVLVSDSISGYRGQG